MLLRTIAALGAATFLLAACGSEQEPRHASDHVSASISEISRCHSSRLSPSVLDSGSTMSQPFVTVGLHNEGAQACWVMGYPELKASGHSKGGPTRSLRTDVRHGSVYERRDPGPRHVLVTPHQAASFTVGTVTAHDARDQVVISSLRIDLPGTGPALTLPVSLDASHPARGPIPVRVTAIHRGG